VTEIRTLDLRNKSLSKSGYQNLLPRAELNIAAAALAIEPILNAVREGNEKALFELCEKYDGI